MKKEKTLGLLLWGVVAYALALLTYFTLKVYEHGVDYLSAFGSILSGIATFYAAFVAIYLYSDWRKPAEFELKKEALKEIQKLLREKYSIIHFLNNELLRRHRDPDLFNKTPIHKNYYPEFNISFLSSELLFIFEEYTKLNKDDNFILEYKNFLELLKSYDYYLSEVLISNQDPNSDNKNYKCNVSFLDNQAFFCEYRNSTDENPTIMQKDFRIILEMMFHQYEALMSKIFILLNPKNHK